MNSSRSQRAPRHRRGRLTTALATALAVTVIVGLSACTGATSGGTPSPGADQVSTGPAAGNTSPATRTAATTPVSSAAVKDVAHQVDLMVSPGGRYDELLRAVLVSVDGKLVVEHYNSTSGPEVTANVFSVTKSVLSMLVGIAIGQGLIGSIDETVADLLPSHAAAMTSDTAAITLRQLLTMTGGLPGTPAASFFDPFESSANWVDAILSSPLAQPAGQRFTYSNASSHLLSAIITEATGQPALDYARAKLFDPLGIGSQPAATPVPKPDLADLVAYGTAPGFGWSADPQGYQLGYSNLKITAADMVKLGQLYQAGGQWHGAQLVPAAWVAESTRSQQRVEDGVAHDYGYQWWVGDVQGHSAFAAAGYAGQLIEVVPDLGLVVAVSCLDGPAAFGTGDIIQLVAQYVVPAVAG